MRRITADYIYTANSSPIKNGVVSIDNQGNILSVEAHRSGDEEKYQGIICPGFVNAHCHTELSFAKNKIAENSGIDNFISQLEQLKQSTSLAEKQEAIKMAIDEMQHEGIVAVGDIINTALSIEPKKKSNIDFYTFLEIYGSQAMMAERIWYSALELWEQLPTPKNIVPHATYSLSRTLFQKIRDFQEYSSTITIHHLESEGEISFFKEGIGPMADRLKSWGLDLPMHIPTHKRPLESIGSFLAQNKKVLLVHNTFIEKQDIDFANNNFEQVYYALCVNANLFIENKLPPVELLKQQSHTICIGTDSLASNKQLSILAEMKTLDKYFAIPLEELIRWACYNGAYALGMESKLGSIEAGKKPGLILLTNNNETFDLQQTTVKVIA